MVKHISLLSHTVQPSSGMEWTISNSASTSPSKSTHSRWETFNISVRLVDMHQQVACHCHCHGSRAYAACGGTQHLSSRPSAVPYLDEHIVKSIFNLRWHVSTIKGQLAFWQVPFSVNCDQTKHWTLNVGTKLDSSYLGTYYIYKKISSGETKWPHSLACLFCTEKS